MESNTNIIVQPLLTASRYEVYKYLKILELRKFSSICHLTQIPQSGVTFAFLVTGFLSPKNRK